MLLLEVLLLLNMLHVLLLHVLVLLLHVFVASRNFMIVEGVRRFGGERVL